MAYPVAYPLSLGLMLVCASFFTLKFSFLSGCPEQQQHADRQQALLLLVFQDASPPLLLPPPTRGRGVQKEEVGLWRWTARPGSRRGQERGQGEVAHQPCLRDQVHRRRAGAGAARQVSMEGHTVLFYYIKGGRCA